jgi:hypothetical protein
MAVEISKVRNDQIAVLRDIVEVTFIDTFANLNSEEDIEIYSAQAFTTERVTQEFQNKNSFFFFVYAAAELAGYLKLNMQGA